VKPWLFSLLCIVGIFIAAAGCTGGAGKVPYTVDGDGTLEIASPPPEWEETLMQENGSVSLSRVIFYNPGGDVYALLAEPEEPVAAIVFAPGAGVKKEAHTNRALSYAEQGIAFLVLDIRGNGGETRGENTDFEREYQEFLKGVWPQTYLTIQDLVLAGEMLESRNKVPVFAAGSSNGARYAIIAAAIDDMFSGCAAVSTCGYGNAGENYNGDARRFLLSVDPSHYIGMISPSPVWAFHSTADTIIPYEDGLALFTLAGEPKEFFTFNGTHGINRDADRILVEQVLTFNEEEY
jgi:dipeptidyl aminopeptidase/acylaminoacyl peptidase